MADIVYNQKLYLDFNTNNAFSVVSVKQNDSGRFIDVYLTKDGEDYPIDVSHGFYFRMRKPDGHAILNPATAILTEVPNTTLPTTIASDAIDEAFKSTGKGFIRVALSPQTTKVPGRAYADIVEYDTNGLVLSTISFIVNIMSMPDISGTTSTDEFQELTAVLASADALLANAPTIDPVTKHWFQYSTDQATKIDTNVVAEGKDGIDGTNGIDGIDGASFFIVDIKTGDQNSEVSYTTTSVIPEGTQYYDDASFSHPVSSTDKQFTAVEYVNQGVYKFINDSNYYYVPSTSVEFSDPLKAQYYIFTIPQGMTGPTGETGATGATGPRGAAGAGGVTWVDGKEATSELHFFGGIEEIVQLTGLTLDSSNDKIVSWTSTNVDYNTIREYLGVAFVNNETTLTQDNLTLVDFWEPPIDGNNYTTKVTLKSSITLPSSTCYLYGRKGTDSGDVRLYSVSYASQSQFVFYTDTGSPETINIDDTMKNQARTNINAMKNFSGTKDQIIQYGENGWEATTPTFIIESTLASYVKSVNNILPVNGDVHITHVDFADNLYTIEPITSVDTFLERTSGGTDNITTGSAYLMKINGRAIYDAEQPASSYITRKDEHDYTVSVDLDKWYNYIIEEPVGNIETKYNFKYENGSWKLSVASAPSAFDTLSNQQLMDVGGITVNYGDLSNINFDMDYSPKKYVGYTPVIIDKFSSIGYNLFNKDTLSAFVLGGDDNYRLHFTYPSNTGIEFSFTGEGESTPSTITFESYYIGTQKISNTFIPPKNGYITIPNSQSSNANKVQINLIWSGTQLDKDDNINLIQPYTIDERSLKNSDNSLELNYVNGVYDSLEFREDGTTVLIQSVGKYSANAPIIQAFSTCDYIITGPYIYVDFTSIDATARERVAAYNSDYPTASILIPSEYSTTISTNWSNIDRCYQANDFGLEYFTVANNRVSAEPEVEIVYTANLVDRLRRSVLTTNAQTLTMAQQQQVQRNLGLISVDCYIGQNDVEVIATDNKISLSSRKEEGKTTINFMLPHLGEWKFSATINGQVITTSLNVEYFGTYEVRLAGKQYGFRRAKNISDPEARITYIGDAEGMTPVSFDDEGVFDYGDWEQFINEVAEPVLLDTGGNISAHLDRSRQDKLIGGVTDTTWTNGNAMVEFRKYIYVKRYEDSYYEYVIFSDEKIDETYLNQACITIGGQEENKFYWGMFEGSAIYDETAQVTKLYSTPSSQFGPPNATMKVYEDYANNIAKETTGNYQGQSHWHLGYKSGWDFICDLITLITKNDNAQEIFGPGICGNVQFIGLSNSDTFASKIQTGGFVKSTSTSDFLKIFWIYNFYGNCKEPLLGLIRANITGTVKAKNVGTYVKMQLVQNGKYGYMPETNPSKSDNELLNTLGYIKSNIYFNGTTSNFIKQSSTSELGFLPRDTSATEGYICDGVNFISNSNAAMLTYVGYPTNNAAQVSLNGPRGIYSGHVYSTAPASTGNWATIPRLTYV